ncbi:hypothetical protein [Mesobacillus selenatarsenatis]|uniref:Lipoprotein n=1 Tax=Mesobacillus selenatarsenatis (strain DSM 18680 / JCM 14380 / FERM P-15431 / SF-1) TaxID=1321606 RepID=A0A0A8X0A5_MESS1|nr:hypothetical protein [Mesobacillus selenatarsenatis]GAM12422.1 hypothetical protein SAMD00020551_0556 [Mesobacillus selenatarsenatis SF-1]
MWKYFLAVVMLFGVILAGCSNGGLSGAKPPSAFVKIGDEKYDTDLGTYCWKGTCVDTAGRVERLEGTEPIIVKAGEAISFEMDYNPKPNKIHLVQFHNNEEKKITVSDNSFTVPTEAGIYYYSYGVWWMDEKEEHLSHGDAFYGFVIEVK